MVEKIEELKRKLNKEIEEGRDYNQILKTSKDIDKLLAEYYLQEVKKVTNINVKEN